MAQQMITLEEAAEKLGITPEEMKKRLKTDPEFKRLSQIRDGSTVRFKLSAIEELGRQLGMASEDNLPLGPAGATKGADEPLTFGESGSDEVFSLTEEPAKQPPKSGKLTPSKGDSDVRLDGGKKPKADETNPTEELSIDVSGPGSAVIKGGSSAKLSAPKSSPSSGKLTFGNTNTRPPDSSEFELSLDADSDDFEMQLNKDAGDEVDIGSMPKDKGTSAKSSKSGINLNDPADSGISLEKGKKGDKSKKKADDAEGSDVDFELSLDSSAAASGTKLGAPKSGKLVLDSDSDSEFELTLEDSSGSSLEQAALGDSAVKAASEVDKGDIFETDFEIPPMEESGSEAVALESDTDLDKSDFELEGDPTAEDSGSSAVVLEDEADAPQARKATKPRKALSEADVDLDDEGAAADDDGAAGALKGAKGKRRDEEDDEDAVPAGTVDRPTKPWGVVPVLFLAPSLLFVMLGALMGYELLNTMWGYQQPRKPTAPLTRAVADTFGHQLNDQ